jgi:hypothetical protein
VGVEVVTFEGGRSFTGCLQNNGPWAKCIRFLDIDRIVRGTHMYVTTRPHAVGSYLDVLRSRDEYHTRLSDLTHRLNDRPDDVTKRVLCPTLHAVRSDHEASDTLFTTVQTTHEEQSNDAITEHREPALDNVQFPSQDSHIDQHYQSHIDQAGKQRTAAEQSTVPQSVNSPTALWKLRVRPTAVGSWEELVGSFGASSKAGSVVITEQWVRLVDSYEGFRVADLSPRREGCCGLLVLEGTITL